MPADKNWARYVFASIAKHLQDVAVTASLPVLVEHLDDRTEEFMRAPDRAEIRITGPLTEEISHAYYRLVVDANVLLTSRYGGAGKNGYSILKYAGLFNKAMDSPIPVWNYGGESGDFDEDDEDTQIFLGCLRNTRPVRVFNFGQDHAVDKLHQSAIDARYEMFI